MLVCGPGFEPNTVPDPPCIQCQGDSVNPNYESDCVNCNGTSLANDAKTACCK